jgi:GNAT superfamily N-acetyltransferase
MRSWDGLSEAAVRRVDPQHLNMSPLISCAATPAVLLEAQLHTLNGETPAMHIRLATEADVPAILELIHALAIYEREPDAVQIGEVELRRDGFGPHSLFECLIADDEGETAGFALYFPIYSTWRGPSLHLEDLFVRPTHRGRGIGKALLARVAAVALERGCTRMQWDVLDWNTPAIDFYQSRGAVMLEPWRIMRVTGAALSRLARSSSEVA